jgi:hypothetical protein
MELPKADGGLQEELVKALAGTEAAELQEMAKRLGKSHADLTATIEELEAEQKQLQEEHEHLNRTISLMMKEMQKLNIGADNTVEPRLDERPLDFVGRWWEKVKPRDTAVVVSEHVGEIKKPVPGQADPHPVQEIGKHVQERGKQAVQRLSVALGPIWQRAEGLIQNVAQGHDPSLGATKSTKGRVRGSEKKRKEGKRQYSGDGSQPAEGVEVVTVSAAVPSDEGPAPEATSVASSAVVASSEEVSLVAEAEPAEPAAPAAPAGATEAPAADKNAEEAAEDEDQIATTILIEARLTIDDGSIQTLSLRATDRCKEVAHRFVQEHSLKAWFEAPLTAWLKKVEADAVKFPVVIEGDLLEIRKNHTKSK